VVTALRVIPDVVDEHAEEAAFLWLLRARAVHAPHYTLDELAALDARIEAHLDGLRLAGGHGWRVASAAATAHREAGEVFTAALLACEGGDASQIEGLMEIVADASEAGAGLASALAWAPREPAVSSVGRLLASPSATVRSAGIVAAAAHGQDPGFVLREAFSSDSRLLRRRAFDAAARLGRRDLLPGLIEGTKDADPTCRFHATRAAVLLGETAGVRALRAMADQAGPLREAAAAVAFRRLDLAEAGIWHRSLAKDPRGARAAIAGAAAMGDPALLPWLIERMLEPAVARLAGEAFTTLTGVDLEAAALDRQRPAGFEPGPTEDAADDDVSMDPDDGLAWPDAARVARWWEAHESDFQRGTRHLCGQVITEATLREVLRAGRQRQRGAAALELVLAGHEQCPFEVRAPGARQLAALAARAVTPPPVARRR
jgi:uncharacterized protein (TIGR02270 family)